jgi:hypothetical protein
MKKYIQIQKECIFYFLLFIIKIKKKFNLNYIKLIYIILIIC